MNFNKIYNEVIRITDDYLDHDFESYLIKDENSEMYGKAVAFDGLFDIFLDMGDTRNIVDGYFCKDSKYYRNKKLLKRLIDDCYRIGKNLNSDDTNNFSISNFHTGDQFALSSLAGSLLVFNKCMEDDEDEKEAREALAWITERMANGCLNSGFHTPNHRWVETAAMLEACHALKQCGRTKLIDRMMEKANKYLAEGVDCDEYGEWSERSAGMYNVHCDNFFLDIYRETKNEEYYDAVYRNLMLMTHYICYDYSMFTQNSRRTDKGEVGTVPMFYKATKYYVDAYTNTFALAGFYKNNSHLASIAYKIFEVSQKAGRKAGFIYMKAFLLHPELKDWEFELESNPLPNTYEIYQPKSNIVRKRTDVATYSFFAKNSCFMQMEANGIAMKVRLCSSFFAIAQFIPQTMEKTEKGYKMTMVTEADYKLPLDNPDGITTKDYWSIDYSKRGSIQKQTLEMSVEIVFTDDGFDMHFDVDKCDKVPTKIEFFVNEGLKCEIGDALIWTKAGTNVFSKGKRVRLENSSGTVIELDGLFCKHLYTERMRGSLDQLEGAFVINATDFTPINKTIHVKVYKEKERKPLF